MFDFEAAVADLVRRGFRRDVAEREVRRQLPVAAPAPDAEREPNVLEKAEQTEVSKLFVAFGFKVRNLSQARASKQAPGLPDLYCVHRELPIALWWETKRQVGGKYSDAQREFKADCERCEVGYGSGDRHAAAAFLIAAGLAERIGGVLEPARSLSGL